MTRFALPGLLLAALLSCSPAPAAQRTAPAVRYEISFENRAHHEAEITIRFSGVTADTLELRMSRSSPGRYALHEFAKNVYGFRATGAGGAALQVTRPDNHGWKVSGHGGEVTVTYTLYADRADGTYSAIDRTHGHLNMPATFMWARGLEGRPIELVVRPPRDSGWRVATQLAPTDDPYRFTAPELAYFLDSPTEVSDFWMRTWEVDGRTIRVALHHEGTEAEANAYADAAAAIVEASRAVYGELPDFDFGTYTFLACYLPWASGDGMEHRNSTVLTNATSLADNRIGLLGTVAHEFFHAWSVERIRPRSLEPFDFERANMSGELWFAEGFTSYYDDLILWRAGLVDDAEFASRMGAIANAVTNARGRRFFSPVEMSMQAPFVDAATSVDPNNRQNTFLSYYTWGSGIGLALDLSLRTSFQGLGLDHLMRDMWAVHGVTAEPYEVADIEASLARVSGDPGFARSFFDRYVRGREAPDFAALLAAAGIALAPARPDAAWIGQLALRFEDGAATVLATPLLESPLYDAGVDRGDRILSVGGAALPDGAAFARVLGGAAPGDAVEIVYESRGDTLTETLRLAADPELSAVLAPDAATEGRRAFLDAWRAAPEG